MTLPKRRATRPRGHARLASVADQDHAAWATKLRTGPNDGYTWWARPQQSHVIFAAGADPATVPLPAPAPVQTLPVPPPAARDTGPMQRLPKLRRIGERPRPARDPDCAIFAWSALIGQHIMLCGTCPQERRSRFADPTAASMPFLFEALRDSARAAGWRLDVHGRWACKACQDTPRYWPAAPVTVYHPGAHAARGRVITGDDGDRRDAQTALRGAADHDLRLSVEHPGLLGDLYAAEVRLEDTP